MALLVGACSGAAADQPSVTNTAATPIPTTTTANATTSTSTPSTTTTTTVAPTTSIATTTTLIPTTTTTTTQLSTTTTQPPTTTTTAEFATHTVIVIDYENTPATVTISAGDQVRWVNDAGLNHNIRSGTDPVADGAWGSPDLAAGASWSRTFDTPGTYQYFCSLHPTLMPGTVVVNP